MLLYHGSNIIVKNPVIIEANRFFDFGTGFYTTTNYEQALNFAQKVTTRRKEGAPVVNIYEINETEIQKLSILKFEKANEKWLDFVSANRTGETISINYDLIIGPVADDDVYQTFTLYSNGFYTKEQAIEVLKIKKLYNQYVFKTKKALSSISFIKAEYGKK